ncbi:UNVERIFIED_CONTAM: hypothetical protein Sangu_3235700 [Sesamum angustifolium]|uniref:Uncharacterized protein n=1 Tax=Sesamum angustifolium TaxID=2727405 RepID=A0AAW2JH19_9LAMI
MEEDSDDIMLTDREVETSAKGKPPKNWAKRIQEEWKILENDLPGKF